VGPDERLHLEIKSEGMFVVDFRQHFSFNGQVAISSFLLGIALMLAFFLSG
jgi:hypothetical protein